jgi:hypothetical protein
VDNAWPPEECSFRGGAAAADRGDGAVFADGCHESGVEFDGGSDVGFDLDLGGVDVLDGAESCSVSHG